MQAADLADSAEGLSRPESPFTEVGSGKIIPWYTKPSRAAHLASADGKNRLDSTWPDAVSVSLCSCLSNFVSLI